MTLLLTQAITSLQPRSTEINRCQDPVIIDSTALKHLRSQLEQLAFFVGATLEFLLVTGDEPTFRYRDTQCLRPQNTVIRNQKSVIRLSPSPPNMASFIHC